MKSLTLQAADERGQLIRAARLAAEELSAESEIIRAKIDALEAAVNAVRQTGAIEKSERIMERLTNIRRARNGMECFHLKCLVTESLDAAWKELP